MSLLAGAFIVQFTLSLVSSELSGGLEKHSASSKAAMERSGVSQSSPYWRICHSLNQEKDDKGLIWVEVTLTPT